MKKLLIISLGALLTMAPSAVKAQNMTDESLKAANAAMKEAQKVIKDSKLDKEDQKEVKKAMKEAKKALKEAQKASKNAAVSEVLATPVANVAAAQPFTIEKPVLTNEGDSIAYIFGIAQSKGLDQYLKSLDVDSTYIEDFNKGIQNRLGYNPENKKEHAYYQGVAIAGQIENMTKQFSGDYYAADPSQKLNPQIVANGIVAGLTGQAEMTADDATTQWRSKMEARQKANQEKLYGENRRKGEAFLEENSKKEGVVTLPSGLQYKVIKDGMGAKPLATDKVKVNYEGHLIDGTEFDSSYKRKEPATFKCNQVIKGWTEALTNMNVGSQWELYIPYNLAYGDKQQSKIPPFSTLIFTVELLDIVK